MRPLFARRRDAGPAKSHRIQPEQQLALVLVGGLSSLSIICPADNANAQRELNSHGPFANGPYEKQSPVRVVAVTSPWTGFPACASFAGPSVFVRHPESL
jgi:hypothetical protein